MNWKMNLPFSMSSPHSHFEDPAWYYAGDSRWLKRRTVGEISRRLQNAVEVKRQFLQNQWGMWDSQASKLGSFWGLIDDGKKAMVFEMHEDGGFSYDWIENCKEFRRPDKAETRLRMLDPKELPLLLEDPDFQVHKKLIEKLLTGEVRHSSYEPDLVNTYHRLKCRLDHMHRLTGSYKQMLREFFTRKFSDLIYDKWERDALFIITIGDTVYHLFHGHCDELNFVPKTYYFTICSDETIV